MVMAFLPAFSACSATVCGFFAFGTRMVVAGADFLDCRTQGRVLSAAIKEIHSGDENWGPQSKEATDCAGE